MVGQFPNSLYLRTGWTTSRKLLRSSLTARTVTFNTRLKITWSFAREKRALTEPRLLRNFLPSQISVLKVALQTVRSRLLPISCTTLQLDRLPRDCHIGLREPSLLCLTHCRSSRRNKRKKRNHHKMRSRKPLKKRRPPSPASRYHLKTYFVFVNCSELPLPQKNVDCWWKCS